MKTTGVVRRLDDYGGIVIPKSIRDKVDLKPNDPIEFYLTMDCDGVILKKRDGFLTFTDVKRFLCHYFDHCEPKEEEQEKKRVMEFVETL